MVEKPIEENEYTTVRVLRGTWQRLVDRGKKTDSMDDIIKKLLDDTTGPK